MEQLAMRGGVVAVENNQPELSGEWHKIVGE